MTNYDIFDEPYYLAQFPWVKPAIVIFLWGSETLARYRYTQGSQQVN
jgi:hypothetical protein